jgi:hypothetical protein
MFFLIIYKTVCPQGMQFFLGQVGRGKDTVCVYLRASAVNLTQFLYSIYLTADSRRRTQTFLPADPAGKNTSIATR